MQYRQYVVQSNAFSVKKYPTFPLPNFNFIGAGVWQCSPKPSKFGILLQTKWHVSWAIFFCKFLQD